MIPFTFIEICEPFKGIWKWLSSVFALYLSPFCEVYLRLAKKSQRILLIFCRHSFKKRCEVCCSSRTDARVHALHSTFHVDVPNPDGNATLCDNKKSEIITNLNYNLNILRAAIHVNDVEIVDASNFEAYRNVAERSYMYRIAVKPTSKSGEFNIPIEEVDRCYIIEYVSLSIEKNS